MYKNKTTLNLQMHRFSNEFKKIIFVIFLFLVLIFNIVTLVTSNIYVFFTINERIYFSFFFISFIFSNLWILSKLFLYLFHTNKYDWNKLRITTIHHLNTISDIFLIILISSWLIFLATWFYNLSYEISTYNTNKNVNLFIGVFLSKGCIFVYCFSILVNFIIFPILVGIYWRKSKNIPNNTIILDSSSLTYSFIFYRSYQSISFNYIKKWKLNELKNIKLIENIKFEDILLDLPWLKKIILSGKFKNPFPSFKNNYLVYKKRINESQPKTKNIIKYYSGLIITSLWAFYITILVLLFVLFILQDNLMYSHNLFANSLLNFDNFKKSNISFLCLNLFWMVGTFFINTFFIHFLNNNYRFFKRDNESSIYDAINTIDINIDNEYIKSMPIFPFFVLIREILLCINIPPTKNKTKLTFNFNKRNKNNSSNTSDFEDIIYNSSLVFIFNKSKLSVELQSKSRNLKLNKIIITLKDEILW